jgi:hypothetical protein
MLGYLGHIISLVGALVGLAGNTWDKKQKGWRKLTPNGRIALSVVLAGFCLSVVTTYSENAKQRCLATVDSSRDLQVEDPGEYCWLKLEFGTATTIKFLDKMQVTYQLKNGSDVYFSIAETGQTLAGVTAATIRPWRLVMSKKMGGVDGVRQLEIDYHSGRCLRDGDNNCPLTSGCPADDGELPWPWSCSLRDRRWPSSAARLAPKRKATR